MASSWTLPHVFAERARAHPGRTLLVAGGRTLTYGQVDAKAQSLAAALSELGIEAGDRIAINMPNSPSWIIALLAGARLGATIVPVNPRSNHHELKYQLRHAEVSVAFTCERHHGVDYLQLFETLLAELPDLLYVVTVGEEELWYDDRIFQFEDLLSSGEGRPTPVPGAVDDGTDFAMIYTSGTMGKPKGVCLTHRMVVETAMLAGEAMEIVPEDRILVSVPLFAIFGLSVAI